MEEDSNCKNVFDSVKNSSTSMNVNKISNFFRNTNKENSIAEKNSEQKMNKIKSELHQDLFWKFRILIMFFKFIGLATFTHRIVTYKKRTSYSFQYCKLGIAYNVVLSSLMIASNYISIPFRLNLNYENKTNLTNSTFMNVKKTSNFFGNTNKINSFAEKNNEQKMNKIKSELHQDLFWTFRILIVFFKLIGLATFAHQIIVYKKRTSYTFQYSKLGIVYNVVLSSLMIASNYLSIPFRLNWNYKIKTNLTVDIAVLQTVLGTLVICVILISYCINQKITTILIEMKKTGNLVHDLLNCAIEKETNAELKKFSLQLLHHKIQFTANGYFTLDNTFFHSLIGTVVTYLIILVQFQMGNQFVHRSDSNVTIQGEI
ncbi:GR66A protein, partial [Acromyrmex heyeri]